MNMSIERFLITWIIIGSTLVIVVPKITKEKVYVKDIPLVLLTIIIWPLFLGFTSYHLFIEKFKIDVKSKWEKFINKRIL